MYFGASYPRRQIVNVVAHHARFAVGQMDRGGTTLGAMREMRVKGQGRHATTTGDVQERTRRQIAGRKRRNRVDMRARLVFSRRMRGRSVVDRRSTSSPVTQTYETGDGRLLGQAHGAMVLGRGGRRRLFIPVWQAAGIGDKVHYHGVINWLFRAIGCVASCHTRCGRGHPGLCRAVDKVYLARVATASPRHGADHFEPEVIAGDTWVILPDALFAGFCTVSGDAYREMSNGQITVLPTWYHQPGETIQDSQRRWRPRHLVLQTSRQFVPRTDRRQQVTDQQDRGVMLYGYMPRGPFTNFQIWRDESKGKTARTRSSLPYYYTKEPPSVIHKA